MMRHVSKFMVSVATVTALSTMAAASAFAETYDVIDAESTAAEGYITVSFDAIEALDGMSQTLLVLDKEIANFEDENDIQYIDQDDNGDITSFVLPADAEGTYYIYVGGDGNIYSGSVTIGEDGEVVEVVIGDVDGDEDANLGDALSIIEFAIGTIDEGDQEEFQIGEILGTYESDLGMHAAGDAYVIGDVDGDEDANLGDALSIIEFAIGTIDEGDQEDFQIGEYANVVVEAE